jgi:hypothetical protein
MERHPIDLFPNNVKLLEDKWLFETMSKTQFTSCAIFCRVSKRILLGRYNEGPRLLPLALYGRFYYRAGMAAETEAGTTPPYTLRKLRDDFVAEVTGIDLSAELPETVVETIKKDLRVHKLLIFRDQGVISGEIQLRITRNFGEVEDRGFEQHSKSPDRLILRVSNDENEGFRDFGSAGFHIDGTFMEMPNAYSLYHIISNPRKGDTRMY